MRYIFSLLAAAGAASAAIVNGNETSGPRGQGNCSLSNGTFTCSSGAECTFDTSISAFRCEGDSGSPTGGITDGSDSDTGGKEMQGPPGRSCHQHEMHWHCDDGSFCEFDNGVWLCETNSSEGGTCVVHGGHTHGDCSDQCGSIDIGEYDQPLHIGAIFILLVSSALGVGLPIAFSGFKMRSFFSWGLFVVKHFGTGVILCTALIHLLFHAFVMFNNDCIGELAYGPAAAAIALAAVYVVFLFDYIGMRFFARKTRQLAEATRTENRSNDGKDDISDVDSAQISPEIAMSQLKWEVSLLEIGIVFHSVMIGVSLGATGGDQFVPFLIAIVFHQLFEGLALGSRVCFLIFKTWHKMKVFIMAVCFSLITPIGIAIGIGVHESYSPNSKSALLALGILNGLSAGVLIYAALVELIANDWFKSPEMRSSGVFKTCLGITMLLLGSLLMAVL
ncbi:hypothetical protein E3P92_02317 [Wallemia ichthyophaga]|nr:hypothetical protein E3P91_02068 [Wallemia ichthyophaga]TIA81775.1 hypothetical protein E3P98_01872 [Wallemia ichthyophaga]TIA91180.1 hypothetical protein E3P97_02182 [Wallemia ichthyophaga]TIB00263.1 hypothetical protein E3P95_01807 [Wallemia ichthyophaga]TIB01408.1 hypothetical protein E3P94_01777 [Wallemia ichthyophaga]